jgi:peptide deformylase
MALMEVLKFPHPILRKKCGKVETIDEEIKKIVRDMAETMYAENGIGLAAPQVGILKQIFVVDVDKELISVINPEISVSGEKVKMEEGCLCLPKVSVEIERLSKAQVKGLDINGKEILIEAGDLLGRALQHETDHLNGMLIIDHLSKVKRDMVVKKFRKLRLKKKKEE